MHNSDRYEPQQFFEQPQHKKLNKYGQPYVDDFQKFSTLMADTEKNTRVGNYDTEYKNLKNLQEFYALRLKELE